MDISVCTGLVQRQAARLEGRLGSKGTIKSEVRCNGLALGFERYLSEASYLGG